MNNYLATFVHENGEECEALITNLNDFWHGGPNSEISISLGDAGRAIVPKGNLTLTGIYRNQ